MVLLLLSCLCSLGAPSETAPATQRSRHSAVVKSAVENLKLRADFRRVNADAATDVQAVTSDAGTIL
ncbi:MAG: hypothetical protein MK538_03375 [Planctomycetes bacterium]|nr:hypothetical protein [Planctomycetota bacterium]